MQKEKIEYLSLGSIIILKGSVKKIMIISRGMVTVPNETPVFFDYGGVTYPEGLVGDQILYFNHENIVKVVFSGYSDDDEQMMVDNINEWYMNSEIIKGDPYEINEKNNKSNITS